MDRVEAIDRVKATNCFKDTNYFKAIQSKQRAIEQQEEVKEEDKNIRTLILAIRELPRLKLTLLLKKDRRVVRVTL